MKRASVENIWVPVVGPLNWYVGPPTIEFSIDDGTNWVAGNVDSTSAQSALLKSGVFGTKCNTYVLSLALNIPADAESIDVLVRLTTSDETAVVDAGSIPIE